MARLLDITLTSRGKSAGKPFRWRASPTTLESYLARLQSRSFGRHCGASWRSSHDQRPGGTRSRARCDSGTLTDESLLDARRMHILAVAVSKASYGLAWLDVSSGRFLVTEVTDDVALDAEIARLSPAEILLPESSALHSSTWSAAARSQPDWLFDEASAREALQRQFQTQSLDGFGCEHLTTAIAAAGALLSYVKDTQRGELPHVQSIYIESQSGAVMLDAATRRNLEIDQTLSGGEEHTLFAVYDSTVTAMGARHLRRWLHRPINDQAAIECRLDAVDTLMAEYRFEPLRKVLKDVADLERILSRVALGSAKPRDLSRLGHSLAQLPLIRSRLPSGSPLLMQLIEALPDYADLTELLERAIVDNPPVLIRDGGVIAAGYDEKLDELRGISENAGSYLLELEQRERAATGLATLKVGYNRVHGYYIEISRTQSDQAPDAYQRRQTLKNVERFITPELKTFEDTALSSKSRALAREKHLYEELIAEVALSLTPLQRTATALCDLDVIACFAERAVALDLCRPRFAGNTLLHIEGGNPVGAVRNYRSSLTTLTSIRSAWRDYGPIWVANQPTCDRMRSLRCWLTLVLLSRRAVPLCPALIVFLRALALRMISPAGGRLLWWK